MFFVFHQQQSDHLGMTDDQILKMGSDKWFDLYIGKKGDTTVSMSEASNIYADVLAAKNLKAVDSLNGQKRSRLLHWLRAVTKYGEYAFVIESRGGGTIWIPVDAAQRIDVEEYFEKLIASEIKGNPSVQEDIETLSKQILDQHEVILKKLANYPKYQSVGVGRAELLNANILAKDLLISMLPEIMKVGGEEALLTLQTMKDLSDPKTLFDPQISSLPLSPGYEIALQF